MSFLKGIGDVVSGVSNFLNPVSTILDVGSTAMSIFGAGSQNKQQQALNAENRDYQTYMSNTAHQREVEDLRKAGLNPILSAKYGGSSTPMGSVASLVNPYKDAPANFNSASRSYYERKNMGEDLYVKRNTHNLLFAQSSKAMAEARSAEATALLDELKADYYKKRPWLMGLDIGTRQAGSILGGVGSAMGAYRSLKGANLDSIKAKYYE